VTVILIAVPPGYGQPDNTCIYTTIDIGRAITPKSSICDWRMADLPRRVTMPRI
jgi:hypothetical protein